MSARVSHLWRHPIKAHGHEAVASVTLYPGRTMPWDRVWAIAHDAAKITPGKDGWAPSVNFSRCAKTAALMAIRAQVTESAGTVTLTHPDRTPITVNPDLPQDAAPLIEWVKPLCDPGRALPAFVIRAPGRGMTDSDFPSISVLNTASLSALEDRMGRPLAPERFRGNIWLDGLAPWEEFDWLGRDIRAGGVTLRVRNRISRCKATTANPETGESDADTLGALQSGWRHRDFGIYAEVVEGGRVAVGDSAYLL